jgi:hypothetical protein
MSPSPIESEQILPALLHRYSAKLVEATHFLLIADKRKCWAICFLFKYDYSHPFALGRQIVSQVIFFLPLMLCKYIRATKASLASRHGLIGTLHFANQVDG